MYAISIHTRLQSLIRVCAQELNEILAAVKSPLLLYASLSNCQVRSVAAGSETYGKSDIPWFYLISYIISVYLTWAHIFHVWCCDMLNGAWKSCHSGSVLGKWINTRSGKRLFFTEEQTSKRWMTRAGSGSREEEEPSPVRRCSQTTRGIAWLSLGQVV